MNKGTKRQAAGSMAYADHKSRFLMIWMLALVLVLTACGARAGTNGGNESATTPTDTPRMELLRLPEPSRLRSRIRRVSIRLTRSPKKLLCLMSNFWINC